MAGRKWTLCCAKVDPVLLDSNLLTAFARGRYVAATYRDRSFAPVSCVSTHFNGQLDTWGTPYKLES